VGKIQRLLTHPSYRSAIFAGKFAKIILLSKAGSAQKNLQNNPAVKGRFCAEKSAK